MPLRRDQYYRSVRERTPLLRRITEEPGAVIRGSISSALENLRHDEEAPITKTRGGFIIASLGLLIFLQGNYPRSFFETSVRLILINNSCLTKAEQ